MRKSCLIKAMALFLSLTGIVLLGFCLLHCSTIQVPLANTLQQNRLVFMAWRYCLCGLVILFWPNIIRIIGCWKKWDHAVIAELSGKWFWVFCFFLVMEFVLYISR